LRALEGAQATDAIADCSLRDVGAARQCLECVWDLPTCDAITDGP
jgi:hypothetical protein